MAVGVFSCYELFNVSACIMSVFFFSSRRRHTRLQGDWSSDVCSSDLRERGFEAYSVTGGMAAWETVYLVRRLAPTAALHHVLQLDRVGKGALSYVLVSDGDAVVVDPGRHLDRYDALLAELDATPAAVIDTHIHADYLSGARAAAVRWQVPYFLHPDDARSAS